MNIAINSEKEFQGYLQKYNRRVPLDNEIYCLFFYLEYLLVKHWQFPINIEIERESPDFILQMSNTKIGLEHTRASCQTLTYGLKKLDDYPEGSMLEIPDCGKIKPSN